MRFNWKTPKYYKPFNKSLRFNCKTQKYYKSFKKDWDLIAISRNKTQGLCKITMLHATWVFAIRWHQLSFYIFFSETIGPYLVWVVSFWICIRQSPSSFKGGYRKWPKTSTCFAGMSWNLNCICLIISYLS